MKGIISQGTRIDALSEFISLIGRLATGLRPSPAAIVGGDQHGNFYIWSTIYTAQVANVMAMVAFTLIMWSVGVRTDVM